MKGWPKPINTDGGRQRKEKRNNMANILSRIGYALKLPGMGISEPFGTPYNPQQTPRSSNAGYTGPIDYNPITSGYGKNVVQNYQSKPITTTPSPIGGGGGQVLEQQTQQQGGGQPDIFGQRQEQAKSQAQLELEQALNEYDYYAEQAQNQIGQLGTQKTSALSEMETALGKSQKQAATAEEEATSATLSAKGKVLTTAQDVQRKNRNVLRALGILSSSAAGEMLGKPMTEYGTQAGELETGLLKRKQVVQDWLGERTAEHQKAVADLEQKYADLVNNIQTDLRFNDRQRVTAVKAAQNALQQRISEIQQSASNYQMAAQNYNANIVSQIAQLQLYQNPQADVSKLLSTLINYQQPTYGGGQVGTQQTEEQRKKALGLSGSAL